ncbi:unnamed protein product [Brachionus calyciflorus]|uniref:Uncharacterized protein n=1 Tax=Brachionus calyciflorus TaxID=104777 RepID=A0A814AFG0_9BILA|nr:unnamed protein product [Brachionus calyciflorus]
MHFDRKEDIIKTLNDEAKKLVDLINEEKLRLEREKTELEKEISFAESYFKRKKLEDTLKIIIGKQSELNLDDLELKDCDSINDNVKKLIEVKRDINFHSSALKETSREIKQLKYYKIFIIMEIENIFEKFINLNQHVQCDQYIDTMEHEIKDEF